MKVMEITVDQMYQIENKGHEMGFLKKFMMENAGAAAVRRLIEKFGNVESKNILIFVGFGNKISLDKSKSLEDSVELKSYTLT